MATAGRALLLTAVLVVVGLGARARAGLDWAALRGAGPDVGRAAVLGLLVAGAGWLVAAAVLRLARHRARRRRMTSPFSRIQDPEEGDRRTSLAAAAAGLVGLAAVVTAALLFSRTAGGAASASDAGAQAASGGGLRLPLWPVLLALVAVLVTGAAALLVDWLARAARERAEADDDADERAAGEDAEAGAAEELAVLAEAVQAAAAELDRNAEARRAVLAAYAAMAAAIAAGLAERGGRPRGTDTPTELLQRAAAAGVVRGTAAGDLTDLFREARFSTHVMTAEHRRRAERLLDRVGAQLPAVREARR